VALKAILPDLSEKVGKALKNNLIIIEPLGGAGNLSYKLSLLKNALCATHVLLDGDQAGYTAYEKAEKDSLMSVANCTFIKCNGMTEAELEDCFDMAVYQETILTEQGVDLTSTKFRGNDKWSQRLRTTFLDQGKLFNEALLTKTKYLIAKAVARNPQNALNSHKSNSIHALVSALERMIKD
jgi:putative ATP-dependent endonuclease of the OLD family